MPKRTDIESVLIIGAGPIVIGQACEFDYSGAQACKALKEEGYRVILVNSNPATIMTDPETADAVYIEPVHWTALERIIQKEKPDALLPTMGGQTGLNCALDLVREGVLEKHKVELIAAKRHAAANASTNPFKAAFHHLDYTDHLPIDDHSVDLLVSLYAGFISEHCTRYLRPGGFLLVNPSHGDAAMADLDPGYRLAAVVTGRDGDYQSRTDRLDEYLIPKRGHPPTVDERHELGRGIAYTKAPFAYLFAR